MPASPRGPSDRCGPFPPARPTSPTSPTSPEKPIVNDPIPSDSPRPRPKRRPDTGQRRRSRPGSPPGELLVDPNAPKPRLSAFRYDAEHFDELAKVDFADLATLRRPGSVLWLDVAGLGDAAVIGAIGDVFGLHRLALEDVLSGHQRAKVESYGNVLFIVMRMPEHQGELTTDQLSLFLGEDFVVSFQGTPGDCFDPIRERLRRSSGRLRGMGADALAYALLDATVDSYFPVLERIGEKLEALEDEVLLAPTNASIPKIHQVRRDLLTLRRATWPQREAISALARAETPLVRPETRVYLNDCYDHTVQVMDLLESYRELGSSLLEVWLSSVSNRMNEVMKLLTIISTIFIPLTFVVGLYGMNFKHMPELDWTWGYPVVLFLMVAIALGMVRWFSRRGWFEALHANRPKPKAAGRGTKMETVTETGPKTATEGR